MRHRLPRVACASLLSLAGVTAASGCGDDASAPIDAGGRDGAVASDAGDGGGGGDAGNPADLPVATWGRDAVVYHVLVRSFADSDGDGHGDFDGLAARLDYIASLGVTAILLLPVMEADDWSGGYRPEDLFAVEDDYGGEAGFARLVSEAHARDLELLVDIPFDTVSDVHPFFVEARSSRDAAHHDDFPWVEMVGGECPAVGPAGARSFYQPAEELGQCYWTKWLHITAEWRYANPAVRDMMYRVVEHWLDLGVDGFRHDSIEWTDDDVTMGMARRRSAGTHAFVSELMRRIKARSPEALLVGEAFNLEQLQVSEFYDDGVDMMFDYPVYFGGIMPALTGGEVDPLAAAIEAKLASVPGQRMGGLFLGNHDVPEGHTRITEVLERRHERLLQAAALLLSLPGTPFIYYGEEIGLPSGLGPDYSFLSPPGSPPIPRELWRKNPMQWDADPGRGFTTTAPWIDFSDDPAVNVAAQDGDDASLLAAYRGLIAVRRSSPALTDGSYARVSSAEPSVYAFLREAGGERVLVLYNFDGAEHPASVDLTAAGITEATVSDRIFGRPMAAVTPSNAGAYGPALPAYGARWLRLE